MWTVPGELSAWQTDGQTDRRLFSFIYIDVHMHCYGNKIKYWVLFISSVTKWLIFRNPVTYGSWEYMLVLLRSIQEARIICTFLKIKWMHVNISTKTIGPHTIILRAVKRFRYRIVSYFWNRNFAQVSKTWIFKRFYFKEFYIIKCIWTSNYTAIYIVAKTCQCLELTCWWSNTL